MTLYRCLCIVKAQTLPRNIGFLFLTLQYPVFYSYIYKIRKNISFLPPPLFLSLSFSFSLFLSLMYIRIDPIYAYVLYVQTYVYRHRSTGIITRREQIS